jgi:hypothetical protein
LNFPFGEILPVKEGWLLLWMGATGYMVLVLKNIPVGYMTGGKYPPYYILHCFVKADRLG